MFFMNKRACDGYSDIFTTWLGLFSHNDGFSTDQSIFDTCNGVCIVALKETFEQSFKLRTRAWLGLFRDNDGFSALFPSAECIAL